jgi:hypothetical protein
MKKLSRILAALITCIAATGCTPLKGKQAGKQIGKDVGSYLQKAHGDPK